MTDFSIPLLFLGFSDQSGEAPRVNSLNQQPVQSVGIKVCNGALAQVPSLVDCADLLAVVAAMY
jgi:hypothetical protein